MPSFFMVIGRTAFGLILEFTSRKIGAFG